MSEKIEFDDGWYNVIPTMCGMVSINGRKSWSCEYRVQVPGYEEWAYRTKFCNFDTDIGMEIMVSDATLLGCKGDIPANWTIDPALWNDKSEPLRMLFETGTNEETGELYPQQAKTLAKSKPFEHTDGYLVKKYEMSENEKAAAMVGIEDRIKLARARTEAFRASKAAGQSTGPARAPAPRGAGGKAPAAPPPAGPPAGSDEVPQDDFGGGGDSDDDVPFNRNVELSW